jgi:DNA-directed RNA polymerase specialized sigma24 family protein
MSRGPERYRNAYLLPALRRDYPWLEPLVRTVHRRRGGWGEVSDLYHAALSGLAMGERTYDPTRGTRVAWLRLKTSKALLDEIRVSARAGRWWPLPDEAQDDADMVRPFPPSCVVWPLVREPWLPWHRLTRQEAQGVRRWLDGETQAEIAHDLGCTPTRVSQVIHMAMRLLRGQLRDGRRETRVVIMRHPKAHQGARHPTCRRGHPRTASNTEVRPYGIVICRVCQAERPRGRHHREGVA